MRHLSLYLCLARKYNKGEDLRRKKKKKKATQPTCTGCLFVYQLQCSKNYKWTIWVKTEVEWTLHLERLLPAFVWTQGNCLSWLVSSMSFCGFLLFFGFCDWWTHAYYAILIPSKEPCLLNHLIFLWSEHSALLFLVEGINLNSIIPNIFSFLLCASEGQWHFNLIREKHTWRCICCNCLLTSMSLSQISLCSSK